MGEKKKRGKDWLVGTLGSGKGRTTRWKGVRKGGRFINLSEKKNKRFFGCCAGRHVSGAARRQWIERRGTVLCHCRGGGVNSSVSLSRQANWHHSLLVGGSICLRVVRISIMMTVLWWNDATVARAVVVLVIFLLRPCGVIERCVW